MVDGDTVRTGGVRYRLVGFDTPEKGDLARCNSECALPEQATQEFGEIIAGGAALARVAFACHPGTEGTQACNYGRPVVRSAHRQRPRRRHHPDQGRDWRALTSAAPVAIRVGRTGVEVAVQPLAAEFLPGKHRANTEW